MPAVLPSACAAIRSTRSAARHALRAFASVADLCDVHVGDASRLRGSTAPLTPGVQVLPNAPPLVLVDYGGVSAFAGEIETVTCDDSNPSVRAVLSTRGDGRVLVVDGRGSTRCALLGDQIAELAVANGWAGVVVNGLCRDAAALGCLQLGVKALGTHPAKSHKRAFGAIGEPVAFGGVVFRRGHWLAADRDGVIIAPSRLELPPHQSLVEALGSTAA
ncbi:hypothetical protein KFE25_007391 [Diacronema lutheri]|uniref:4-hydroxy-4-methyl-2-oxoglutarate aldolase n=1 Tax=Diacronema lutheri TaxID=2081491 RepID=A0A8J5XJF0_DIALT|nr:hypothetical protein KFE25_007391 [Diacronema lutheri]